MRKDWKYIVYLSLFIGTYVAIQLISPKNHDWSITLSHHDKDPYGTFALNEVLPALFTSVTNTNKTLYELINANEANASILSMGTSMHMEKEDTEALLKHVEKGNSVFLSAHYFSGKLSDTLNIGTIDYLFDQSNIIGQPDSVSLHFVNPTFDTLKSFNYKRDNVHNYFNSYDTLRTTIVGRNDLGEPVTLKIAIGSGALILNSTPLAFTNINMLSHENNLFVSQTLSYLTQPQLIWTEYYHLGRMEADTPLRFILTQEPLAWAYYILVLSLLLFLLFESRRKQRIIPIINPLQNTSLEFVSTIGNLYYQNADHRNIADKKISFFIEALRTRFNLVLTSNNYDSKQIARKTGNDEIATTSLFGLISSIQTKNTISSEELMSLNKKIENYLK